MKYTTLLEVLAKENKTTPEEVEREMQFAIREVGYNIEPAIFISLIAEKVKRKISK